MDVKLALRWRLYSYGSGRTALALRALGRTQVRYAFNVSLRHKYVYVDNPKTGSTSLKSALIELETGAPAERSQIHKIQGSPFNRLEDVGGRDPIQTLLDENYLFVTMVRNPYDRLASAYRSAIVRPTRHKRSLLAHAGHSPEELDREFSFEEFVRFAVSTSDRETNSHWRRQASQIHFPIVPYGLIGRFEELEDSWRELMDLIEVPVAKRPSLPHKNITRRAGTSIYDLALQKTVHEHYIEDFESFGYGGEVPDGV